VLTLLAGVVELLGDIGVSLDSTEVTVPCESWGEERVEGHNVLLFAAMRGRIHIPLSRWSIVGGCLEASRELYGQSCWEMSGLW
jgi:hypothetical protein